jgi:hypothetical protein
MRGSSKAFQSAVVGDHISICRVDVVRDGRVVQQLAVHKGGVTADKTAAQLRNFDVEVSDPEGTLTPAGMASLLAPFGTRLQLWRGIRFENITTLRFYANSPDAWQVVTPQGQMNGVVADPSTGELRMGP